MNNSSNKGDRKKDRQAPKLGNVQDVQQKLYSKNTTVKPYVRQGFSNSQPDEKVSLTWDELRNVKEKVDLVEKKKKYRKPMTAFSKILLMSVLFFMFSMAGAFMVFFYGKNEVTYEATTLAVRGPNSIAGGEKLSFDISVINENPVNLVLTDVIVNYPRGTITSDAQATVMKQDVGSIDEIRPGFEETVKFDAVLFGKEGETKDIGIVFQYRVPGSDNLFFKERLYQVVIESSPVTLAVEHEKSYQSGDEVEITMTVTANATTPLRNLLLQVDYPFGFEFASSSAPGLDSSTFLLREIEPGKSVDIVVQGVIVGQDNEERTFRYVVGAQDSEREGVIASSFAETKSVLAIAKPAIGLTFAVGDDSSVLYVARSGSNINFILEYVNTLASKILDGEIKATILSDVFDQTKVGSPDGFYRSNSDTITWTQSEKKELGTIESGEKDSVGFNLQLFDADQLAGLVENPEMTIVVGMEATSFEEGGTEQKVKQEITKRITIATDVAVAQELLYSEGPLENSGPIQPTVGEKTTYTVHWQVANTTNKISGVEVSAVLPAYVTFKNVVAPSDQSVTFDERSRTVTWSTVEMSAGLGYSLDPAEVFFTVEVEPSLNQVGDNIDIVGDIAVEATDEFTKIKVVGGNGDLDSRISSDELYTPGQSRVTQ